MKPFILRGDWTFVTKNSTDFRGSKEKPGSKGQYADVSIHAGLVCLNGPTDMDLAVMMELFEAVLSWLALGDDLVNQVLEVTLDAGEIHVLRYALPA